MKKLIYFLLIIISTTFLISCGSKANLVYKSKINEDIGKGKEISLEVIDIRSNKKFCRSNQVGCVSLSKPPENLVYNTLSDVLTQKGFIVDENSNTKLFVEINEFYLEWTTGVSVDVNSEVSFFVTVLNNDTYLLEGKRVNTYQSEVSSVGGWAAVPIAEKLIDATYTSTFNKFFKDKRIIQSLLGTSAAKPITSQRSQDNVKNKAVVVPIGVMGQISDTQTKIITNKFLDELSNDFDLVPQKEYEKAEEEAFQQLNYEECTEEQCIRLIQEMLQVENMFQIQLIREGKDTQVSLILIDLDRKLVKSDYCEGCNTPSLIKIISKLYNELKDKR